MECIKGIGLSFYSQYYYYRVAHVWRGIGMGNIFILTFLMSFSMSLLVILVPAIRQGIYDLPAKAETLPAITLSQGRLSIDKPVPYRIPLGTVPGHISWIIIDTDYQANNIDELEKYMRQNNVLVLAMAQRMISLKDKDQHLEITDYTRAKNFSVTHDDWGKLGAIAANWGIPLLFCALFIALFIGLFIGNFFFTFCVACAIFLVGKLARRPLDFAASMRLASAMRMPVVILSSLGMVTALLRISQPVSWILWAGYLLFAVWSSKSRAVEMP